MNPRKLRPREAEDGRPRFLGAEILPERGMMLTRLSAELADGSTCDLVGRTPPSDAMQRFGSAEDVAGNLSFAFGGAILLPYANRVRGTLLPGGTEIEAQVASATVRLPANWRGKRAGSERYAMHGLILDRGFTLTAEHGDAVEGELYAGDFGGHWTSASHVTIGYRLTAAGLSLSVIARNVGHAPLPMAIGWHPYFALPSGSRRAARLHIPARRRLAVTNYDEVLPSGEILGVAGTAYDFASEGGRALDDMYLDDCFVDLVAPAGRAEATIWDPPSGLAVHIQAASPPVAAFQVYAPPGQPFVAVEPQFNWTDPFSPIWQSAETGAALLAPGERATYAVRVTLSPADDPAR